MAFVIPNRWTTSSKQQGLLFEDQIREHLRISLPPTYAIMHSAILVDPRPEGQGRGRPREIDFIVAGPTGLFLIEAKCRPAVRGSLWDAWVYSHKDSRGRVSENADPEGRPGHKMKVNLARAGKRVRQGGGRMLEAYGWPRAIFVFPKDALIEIHDERGNKPPVDRWAEFEKDYFFTRLPELAALLLSFPKVSSPEGRPNAGGRPSEEAEKVLRLFEVGTRPDPNISGNYTILERGRYRAAANGLPYAVCKLQHTSLGYIRRGKWYDMTALGEKQSKLFEAQVQRHPLVQEASRGQENVHRLFEYTRDLIGNGFWVIEEWIEGDMLDDVLESSAAAGLDSLSLMRQIARGLKAVHAGGFVCRDLAPGSIIVETATRRPVLTNFEAAKMAGGPTVTAGGSLSENSYRAPELRAAGGDGETDARADIWSWGALFFRLTTGGVYEGASSLAKLEGAGLPSALTDLIKRCLSPLRSQRPGSMDAILAALPADS